MSSRFLRERQANNTLPIIISSYLRQELRFTAPHFLSFIADEKFGVEGC